jgi:cytidine deaminase
VVDVADLPEPAAQEDARVVAEALLARARELRANAYAPYSGFHVGAVVLTASGRRFEGVNVENVSYRLTTCAEQTALAAMCAAGAVEEVVVVAVAGDGPTPCTPCGACRQTIAEFGAAAVVHATGTGGAVLTAPISELLPAAFTPERLRERGEVPGGGA